MEISIHIKFKDRVFCQLYAYISIAAGKNYWFNPAVLLTAPHRSRDIKIIAFKNNH